MFKIEQAVGMLSSVQLGKQRLHNSCTNAPEQGLFAQQ